MTATTGRVLHRTAGRALCKTTEVVAQHGAISLPFYGDVLHKPSTEEIPKFTCLSPGNSQACHSIMDPATENGESRDRANDPGSAPVVPTIGVPDMPDDSQRHEAALRLRAAADWLDRESPNLTAAQRRTAAQRLIDEARAWLRGAA